MKIKYKLLLTYGILVILSFAIVGVNLLTFQTMESDSNFVNYSGKLRATSYKMAQLSNVLINSKDDEKPRKELEENILLYDSILNNIYYGNAELGMSKLTHMPTIEKLIHIKEQWHAKYKGAFQSVLKYEDLKSLELINSEIANYVGTINEMVTSYSENSSYKVIHAKLMNWILIIIAVLVAFISFLIINNGIRKPISSLIEDLKKLSLVDNDLAKKIELANTDEITEMTGYFNELIYDALTKAFNRKSGIAKLSSLIQHDDRRQIKMSLCFIDINGLKQVNDVLGHKYGDELIVSVVNVIKSVIREYDFIIRLGGDEFLIVFSGINIESAEAVWKRIVDLYEKINQVENRKYLISVSHGIVDYNNKQKSEVDILIKDADEKMYEEKRVIKEVLKLNVIR